MDIFRKASRGDYDLPYSKREVGDSYGDSLDGKIT